LGATAALRGTPAAKPDAPAPPVAEPVLSPADIQQLRTAIDSLRQRFEGQGDILKKLNQDLNELGGRADQNLRPVDLDPLKESFRTIVVDLHNLQGAVGKLAASVDQRSGETTTRIEGLAATLARLQEQATRLDDNLAQLRKSEAARPALAPRPEPAFSLATVAGLAAGCTLLLAGLILFVGRLPRRERQAGRGDLAAAAGAIREELERSLQASTAEWNRTLADREQRLTKTLEEVQRLVGRLDRKEPPLAAASAPAAPTSTEERTTVPGAPRLAYSDALWPAPFLDPASPLARWRALLESHLASPEHPALPVLSAVLALRVAVERAAATPEDVAEAVAAVSLAAHGYWHTLAELSEEDRQRASADWVRGLKQLVATVTPTLEIREIIPGVRFDPATMQTVQDGPGNHLNVATVFSWAILDRAGERPKVLHRARIATT
jgi:ABC-type transporter Mla subunit MlaD